MPDLIATKTSDYILPDIMLQSDGSFLLFVQECILPICSQKTQGAFTSDNRHEQHLVSKFKKQLQINNRNEFKFQAVSILINDDLYPHTDSLNPSDHDRDYTIVLTTILKTSDITEPTRRSIKHIYPETIPICVVLYN